MVINHGNPIKIPYIYIHIYINPLVSSYYIPQSALVVGGLNPHDQMLVPERPELVEAVVCWLIE